MACTDCDDELEHCHGVLVRHGDGRLECVDEAACAGGAPAHGWAVPCIELGCRCAGERPDEEVVRLAA